MMNSGSLARQSRRRIAAFTLIELMVVIALASILASLAAVSLGGTMDRYRLSQAEQMIEAFDAAARRDARRRREPVSAIIQRSRQRLILPARTTNDKQYRLPRHVEIKQIRLRRRLTAGRDLELLFNREGTGPTYAVELVCGKSSRWLVVLGISGQIIALQDRGEVDEILAL
jgi:prepilin-type N-terminal cleavage/methylation domain-containing protein